MLKKLLSDNEDTWISPTFSSKFLSFYEWIVFNSIGFSFLLLALINGWINIILQADIFYITPIIFGIFIWGVLYSGLQLWRITIQSAKLQKNPKSSALWNKYREMVSSRSSSARPSLDRAFEIRMSVRLSFFNFVMPALVMLGFLGTVIGLLVGAGVISGVDISDISQASTVVAEFMGKYSIALYTTLVGTITWVWTRYNYYLLTKATGDLVASVYETADRENV